MTTPPLSRWLREPLLHFLVLGFVLFAAFRWSAGGRSDANRIVITPGQVDSIIAGFVRTWQRPPSDAELKAELDHYVRDEIASREAIAMGLDRDDTIIRRRLRQKFEFLTEDALDVVPPTEAQLQGWLRQHAADFRIEPRVAFRQVMLSEELRGASLEKDARALQARLASAPAGADVERFGDSVMLPTDVSLSASTDVARMFGPEFADAILKVEPGRWSGPLKSGYGMHVVFVLKREEGRIATLDEARPQVERGFTEDRRARQLDEVYAKLLDRYRIVVEQRPAAVAATAPKGSGQ